MMNLHVQKLPISITGALEIQPELPLASTKELLRAAAGINALFLSWFLHPNKHSVCGTAAVIKARTTLLFEAFGDGSLLFVVFRERKREIGILAGIDGIHNVPQASEDFGVGNAMDKSDVFWPPSGTITEGTTKTNWCRYEAINCALLARGHSRRTVFYHVGLQQAMEIPKGLCVHPVSSSHIAGTELLEDVVHIFAGAFNDWFVSTASLSFLGWTSNSKVGRKHCHDESYHEGCNAT